MPTDFLFFPYSTPSLLDPLPPPQEKEDAEAEDRRKRGLAAAGHCDACGKALVAKKAFSRFEFRYCSSDCANLHKRKLAADAAERRFNGGGAGADQK